MHVHIVPLNLQFEYSTPMELRVRNNTVFVESAGCFKIGIDLGDYQSADRFFRAMMKAYCNYEEEFVVEDLEPYYLPF